MADTTHDPMRLGAVLPTAATLGHPPGVGNGFHTRAAEDLRLLADLGLGEVRLGVDWARLQPEPGRVDDDWREWYQGTLDEGRAAGLAMWATLWEGPVPGWFADEGGFADDRAAGRWWPRWVETAADVIGDRVDGWFPMDDPVSRVADVAAVVDDRARHSRALTNTVVAWRDAWRILRGGPPVATALGVRIVRAADQTVPAQQAARTEEHLRWRLWLGALRDGSVTLPDQPGREVPDLAGALDVLGVVLERDVGGTEDIEQAMPGWEERVGTMLRRVAEDGPTRPVVVAALRLRWPDDDDRRLMIEAFSAAVNAARRDGVEITGALYDPAIDPTTERADERDGLIDRNRDLRPSSAAWLALAETANGS